jgi:hypothetical protein
MAASGLDKASRNAIHFNDLFAKALAEKLCVKFIQQMAPDCRTFTDFRLNFAGSLKCGGRKCECASNLIDVSRFEKKCLEKMKDDAFGAMTQDDKTDLPYMFSGKLKPFRKEYDAYDLSQYFALQNPQEQLGFALVFSEVLDTEMKKILQFKELGCPKDHDELWNRMKMHFSR